MKKTDVLAEALTAYRDGDEAKAADLAGRAGSTLGTELHRYLNDGGGGPVYDQPAAFTAFIRGGGNVQLYRKLSAMLARRYGTVGSLLDLGCGDGLAVVPALEQADRQPGRIDLVEPSSALLAETRKHLDGTHGLHTWDATAQEFLARDDDRTWQLTQSTFALQSIPTEERTEVLRSLRPRTSCLVLAEFDVPEYDEDSAEYLLSLVTRYERGISEYGKDASLVAQGFLLPILLGLIDPAKGRTNWEQPATDWASQLKEAGFTGIRIEPLADYWWSPAVLLTAS
ncbi:class I SAM-dependent methyltransferase [Amycolatopsis orientalis]|uniref:class I SAM-dependent methyltransferase n=1 Tax=Amycolatopsis orientalis TaxID=31958 RepID=UPI0004274FB6|nr:class I SAM-dependent methyltransferase [Amycolatopsis orientalis]